MISDLKAFERRLTEIMSGVKPATNRWRGNCAVNKKLFLISTANALIKLLGINNHSQYEKMVQKSL